MSASETLFEAVRRFGRGAFHSRPHPEVCEACRGTGQWFQHGGVSTCMSCDGTGLGPVSSRPRLWVALRCYPHGVVHYWRPRRITASWRDRHVYRWLAFNFAPRGLPRG